MNAHVLLNLLKELGKSDKMQGLKSSLSLFFATSLMNLIIQEPGWVVTWFLLGYIVRKNGGLLSTPMF